MAYYIKIKLFSQFKEGIFIAVIMPFEQIDPKI